MNSNNRNLLVWGIIVVIAIVGIWGLLKNDGKLINNLNPTATPTSSPQPSGNQGKASSTPTSNLTYEQVLQQYSDRKIQFNDACQGTPNQFSIKQGTKILLDNRSNDTKTLKIEGTTVTLPAYHWQIITVKTTKSLPYDLAIDCSSKTASTENGVTIKVQANILQGL